MRQFQHTFPRRLGALLLCLALVAGLMPTAALAADGDKTIMLGTSGIKDPTAEGSTYYTPNSYIYFGMNGETPIKWRVLDADKANDNRTDGMFLLSEYLLASGVQFEAAWNSDDGDGQTNPNEWQHSDAQVWCKTFASNTSNFSAAEQSAMLGITKTDSTESNLYSLSWGESSLTADDKMFFLSVRELADYVGSYGGAPGLTATTVDGSAGVWWLRSPYAHYTYRAGAVYTYGNVGHNSVDYDWAARPAFNLNLNSVLFTSAAVGGKIPAASSGGNQGGEAADAIFEIGDYTGNEWKLTLLDNSRNFAVTEEAASGKPGDTITLNYTGATTGTNEYISVIIADSSGAQYYGRVAQPTDTDGKVEITIPSGLADGTYTLYVFSEQYNGGEQDDTKLTDYASAFETVALTVSSDTTAPTLTSGSATRDSENAATVKFTSDEAGEYYYAVVESGDNAPTIGTTGAGTSCISGENTISLTTLTGLDAKDIYIVAKDAAGNVSQQLKITIPAYIAPSYGISASPAALDFGSKTAGYTEAPAAQTVTLTNTGNQNVTVTLPASANYTITAGEGFAGGAATLAPNGTAAFTVQPNTGLAAGTYDETLTVSGGDNVSASIELSFTVLETYTLTVDLNGGSGSTIGGEYTAGEVVNIDAGSRSNYRFDGWTSSNGGTFTDASSASTTFTMPAADTTITANWQYDSPYIPPTKPDGPSTGDSDGWEDIQEEIADAEKGDTITIDMGDETEVPGEIFEEVAGKDVTVEFDMGDGVSWAVNGQDVPTNTTFSDLDLGVDLGTSGISVDVINAITGEHGSVQVTLEHDGEFGFVLTLTAPLGKENKGLWANLYHYDEKGETLTFETSAQIDDKGDVSLRMTHASQYAIVIDDKSHELPFTDLGEGQWYEPAVRYAYIHDIMEGMSDTTFVPDKSLTRAEAVQVFYNMEGKPTVSGSTTFPDLVYEWYKLAIAWAESTDVVDGYEDGTFRPDEPVTRQEFAQMLYNYAAYKGYDLTAQGDLSTFPDGDQVQKWALPAMAWANGNELINGHDDGTLEPGGTTIRSQAAAILMRFDQKLAE